MAFEDSAAALAAAFADESRCATVFLQALRRATVFLKLPVDCALGSLGAGVPSLVCNPLIVAGGGLEPGQKGAGFFQGAPNPDYVAPKMLRLKASYCHD